jgi:sugar O-acyltransferase (sialic acid O-acetyltransferase NeuD family)
VNVLLIGGGGHSRVVAEIIACTGGQIVAYADVRVAAWLPAPRYQDEAEAARAHSDAVLALGFGATTPDGLRHRLNTLGQDWARERLWPVLIHPHASVAGNVRTGAAVQIMAGARVQPGAIVERGAIINTGAIVEHDSTVGDGCHVAPGAIVLGDCAIGEGAMIGAGAVILPGASVPAGTLVPAATRYPR